MKIKATLITLSLFLFSLLYPMEENNLPELPLLEEVALLHSSMPFLLDTDVWDPVAEQEIQKTGDLEEVLFISDNETSCMPVEEKPIWRDIPVPYEKKSTHIVKKFYKFYICSYCTTSFKYISHLRVHERRHTGEKPFICNYPNCNYASAKQGDLNRHKRTHNRNELFICDYLNCSYTSVRKEDLEKHQRTHTGEKPFICNYPNCNYAAAQMGSLILHKRTHTGEKPYQCDYQNCSYASAQIGSLAAHKRTHIGEKPYHCDYLNCDYTSSWKGALNRHQLAHTGERPYQCDHPHCGYASVRRSNLTTHQRTHISEHDAALILATKKAKLNPPDADNFGEKK